MKIYTDAVKFAKIAHYGQYRRFTGDQYITHPMAVVKILRYFGLFTPITGAKAVMHDVVEDTETTLEDIRYRFGDEIANSCFRLCDPEALSPMPEYSKQQKLDRYGVNIQCGTSTDVNIKLADIMHNVPSMVMFAKHAKALSYVREKKYFLKYLTHGDPDLYYAVSQMLKEQEAYLIAL